MSMSAKIQQIIDSVVKNETLSGTSLISTIFGDSVLHRGGNISLASLIQLLELFGFNDRAVRTSVFRLVKMIGYAQTKSAEPVFIELPIRAVRLICKPSNAFTTTR